MTMSKVSPDRVTVTRVGDFLLKPPDGFSVEVLDSGYRVYSDPERSLVLIDDFSSCGVKVVFHNSLGRRVKMHNLWEYTGTRRSLLSKRVYLLVSAAGEKSEDEVLYVVSIDGNDPFIGWQIERGLDRTISSVVGESYRVNIDFSELLESWEADNLHIKTDEPAKSTRVWRDAFFTLKYYSDALFDFPHWFGFSKKTFKLRMMWASSG